MGETSEEAWKAAADAVAARYAEQADAALKVAQEWERRGVALLQRAKAAEARVTELEGMNTYVADQDTLNQKLRAEKAEARVRELERLLAKALAHTIEVKASKAELIFAIEEWMSDALLELPHDAVELSRILAKHRGQP